MAHRAKPFSTKQKKQQIMAKRERKKQQSAEDTIEEFDPSQYEESVILTTSLRNVDSSGRAASGNVPVAKLNQQPREGSSSKFDNKPAYDPNRYRLHFYKESKEDLKRRKEAALLPIKSAIEKELEMKLEELYKPGSELDIPQRPPWDYSMSREELDRQEYDYFHKYVKNIMDAHSQTEDLSYFELNLETWRQLWRVMEISDIFLVIVDLRFPLLHFPPSLFHYLDQKLHKPVVLVLNKLDLVPASLAIAWKMYFEEKFSTLRIVIFGAAPRLAHTLGKKKPTSKKQRKVVYGIKELIEICRELIGNRIDTIDWTNIPSSGKQVGQVSRVKMEREDSDVRSASKNRTDVLTIGCIGEPNVGKSSVMNALIGRKVVSVSRTPGHTKHLQTIFLAKNVRLCDCPGLVFPATAPRVLQILAGIYPIAQVSDPYSVIGFLAARIPLIDILKLRPADKAFNIAETMSAMEICEAWALRRGFLTAKAARPDVYRAANHLLRMALEGKLCLRLYPPGFTEKKSYYDQLPETQQLKKDLEDLQNRLAAPGTDENKESQSDNSTDNEESSDEESDSQQNFINTAVSNKFAALASSD